MGSMELIRKLKSRGKKSLTYGIIMTLLGALMIIFFVWGDIIPLAVLFLLWVVMGGFCIYSGIDNLKGENSRFVRKNPNILTLADDLAYHTVYENNFIRISNKAIAPKKDITRVADTSDVLAIYENIQRMNGIVTSHVVKLELRNGKSMDINVYARKQETKDNLVLIISKYCPNAKVGFSGENMSYVQEERQKYKKK